MRPSRPTVILDGVVCAMVEKTKPAVIKFEHPVGSIIVILPTPGYEINAEVKSGVIKHVHDSGITTEPFSYMNFNGIEWIQYHGHRIVKRFSPLVSSFDNRNNSPEGYITCPSCKYHS